MIAAVFPGQGSQKPGMGRELAESFPVAAAVFDDASQATGLDIRHICFELDEETLRQTDNAQIALFTCGVAAFTALQTVVPTLNIGAFAGHSIGEYAALTCAGALTVADGARLVQRRGELMAASGTKHPGTMAAILGLERDALQAVCEGVPGIVVIANDNCPGQLVISGEVAAVTAACEAATAAGARRAMVLNVSGAFHSPLMVEPAVAMGEALRAAKFKTASAPVISNVLAAPGADWPDLLETQLRHAVRWTESMQFLVYAGLTTIIECGSGEVLGGLMKRISRDVQSLAVFDTASLEKASEILSS